MRMRLPSINGLTITAILMLWPGVGLPQAASIAGEKPGVTQTLFGKTPSDSNVALYTLTNANGLRAKVMEYGAILVSLEVPDREGKMANIVRGFEDLDSYTRRPAVTGATIGRYANRISNARFTLDGVEFHLTVNARPNQIHGGQEKGFNNVVWCGHPYQTGTEAGVRLTHLSLDGEEGFPGNLNCEVTYALTHDNELRIDYRAFTDKPTVINLTNHSYFNLAGANAGSILGHEVTINARWYTPVGEGKIPTGEIRSVEGTPLDFTKPRTVGERIDEMTPERGYDHNYVLNRTYGSSVLAARAYEPKSGRVMETYTTEPGMQFYTGDRNAFCFETQHFPDSPNKPHFPSTELRPGGRYESSTVFKFSTK